MTDTYGSARLAALFCLTLGASFCARPVRSQTLDTVTITSWTSDAPARPLHAGEKVTATMVGTVGARARLCVPGVISNAPLREVQPGRYVGTVTVPKNVSVTDAALVGILSVGKTVAPLVQAGTVTLDSRPPTVDALYPPKGATAADAAPLVSALLSDAGGSGIDPATVRLSVDNVDVTKASTVTPYSVTLRPASLAAGPHAATVTAADRAGNPRTVSWHWNSAAASPSSFTSNAPADGVLPAGRTVRFSLHAPSGGRVRVSIGTTVSNVVLAEGRTPGLYTGEYTVLAGDAVQNAPVTAQVKAGGRTEFVRLPQTLSLTAGPLRRPKIMFPPDDVYVADTIEVAGQAAPNSEVLVTASFVSTGAGGAFPVSGTASSQSVRVDGDGKWQTDGLPLSADSALLASSQSTVWTLSARSVASDGTLSEPAALKVRRG